MSTSTLFGNSRLPQSLTGKNCAALRCLKTADEYASLTRSCLALAYPPVSKSEVAGVSSNLSQVPRGIRCPSKFGTLDLRFNGSVEDMWPTLKHQSARSSPGGLIFVYRHGNNQCMPSRRKGCFDVRLSEDEWCGGPCSWLLSMIRREGL